MSNFTVPQLELSKGCTKITTVQVKMSEKKLQHVYGATRRHKRFKSSIVLPTAIQYLKQYIS